jgi:hypothetical protein
MKDNKSIFEKALENINHPLLSEITLGEEAPPGGNPPQYLWELILIPATIAAAEGTLGAPGQYYAAYDYNGDGVNDYADVDAAIEIYLSGIAPMTAPAYFAFMAKLDAADKENRLQKGGAQIQIGTELGSKTAKAPTPPPDTGVRESINEGSEIIFSFDNPMKAGAFASRIMRDKLASEVDRYVSGRKEMVQVIMHPNDYERNDIEKLAKQYKGQLREDLQLEERAMTYVIDRKTKKIVHGPTDTGDAKLYVKKQIQPRKFMIRQIRGAAKKVGDTV